MTIYYSLNIDNEAIEKELDHLKRLMRSRQIEETEYDELVKKIVASHCYNDDVIRD